MLPLSTTSAPAEGVIQFRVDLTQGPPSAVDDLSELNAWRTILFRLRLTGRDPARYAGLAYGNVSRRLAGEEFLMSGTQTGGLAILDPEHYARVTGFDIAANSLAANGLIAPSSEALTHAAVYRHAPWVNSVLHVHCPEIWASAAHLDVPVTPAEIGYGTPAMADSVGAILRARKAEVIVMGGHEDGVIAAGATPSDAARRLIEKLAEALRLSDTADQSS